jgi:hypothetical protein
LASGSIAKNFIDWIGKKRVADNKYDVACYKEGTTPKNIGKNIRVINADPTSFAKLSRIMNETNYNNIFIVMEDLEDARYALKNIALIENKARITLVNQWEEASLGDGFENINMIHSDGLIAAHLYDNLPNVPLVAQNVGLGRGEIMEIHVPFGSSYAFRHIGSILQRKWKIAAIYRDEKQILPTSATMIRPNDTLLVLGKPRVLDGVYKTINKRIGQFPEPHGKDIYLILDFRYDVKNALRYIKEVIFLMDKLKNKSLYIRLLYPNDFALIDAIKSYESDTINISVGYDNDNVIHLIEYDINQYDIGLILNSIKTFEASDLKETLYDLKKLVYLFGDKSLQEIEKTVVLMSENDKMESISSTAFDISESLDLGLVLCDFDPEGDFKSKKMIIEHYETLTHIFNMEIDIQQELANPIRELSKMENILQIAPFEERLNTDNFMKLVSTQIQDFILTTNRHPKLLVPFAPTEQKEEE